MTIKDKYIIMIILCITALTGCKEEYIYPRVTTEFCDVKTDGSGRLSALLTDRNELLHISYRPGIDGFTKDSTYRCTAKYTVPENTDSVFLYSLHPTVSHQPIAIEKFLANNEGIIQDPVTLESIWSADRFINMILLQKNKDIPHLYQLIDEGIQTSANGQKTVGIIIYHNRMDDYEAFNSEVYVSIPLNLYNNILTDGDRIQVKISTYNRPNDVRTFERKNNKWILTD